MLTAIILLTLTAPADAQKEPEKKEEKKEFSAEAKKELKKLEGKWQVVKAADAAKESEFKEEDTALYFVFKGTEVTMMYGDKKETIHVAAIDPTTDPKCIDLLEKPEGRPERTLEGVYKIDGDTLRLAFSIPKDGKNRPTRFDKPGERTLVWTMKRVKE